MDAASGGGLDRGVFVHENDSKISSLNAGFEENMFGFGNIEKGV